MLIAQHKGIVESKKILKDICADKFGESFAYRDKMGFGIPLREFFSSKVFQEKWHNQIAPGIQKRNLFKEQKITHWVKNITTATPDQLDSVWLMLGFELWAQQYLD